MLLAIWFLQEEGSSGGGGGKILLEALKPHISAGDYIVLTIMFSVATTVASIVMKNWIEDRFKKEMERFKRDLTIRDQAAKVAELLALMHSGTAGDVVKANQLSWEMSLWLPSGIAKKLGEVLSKADGATSRSNLLIEVRHILLEDKAGDLKATDIATF